MRSDPSDAPRGGNGDHEIHPVGVLDRESRLKSGEAGKRIAEKADSADGIFVVDRGKISGVGIPLESKGSNPQFNRFVWLMYSPNALMFEKMSPKSRPWYDAIVR